MSGGWIITELTPDSSPVLEHVDDEENQQNPLENNPNVFEQDFLRTGSGVSRQENGVKSMEDAKSKWISSAWPITPFNGGLKVNERKAEWFRFRNQFEDIASCKVNVDPMTKLSGLKIYAGQYLRTIIESQIRKFPEPQDDIYSKIIESLNDYFNKTCDVGKERIKFRDMEMREDEAFEDWIIRLETQAVFCEFGIDQENEEFMQAILRRSVPDISTKLYEMSEILGGDLERIKTHGQHLDFIRRESMGRKVEVKKEEISSEASSLVNALRYERRGREFDVQHKRGGHRGYNERGGHRGYNDRFHSRHHTIQKTCSKCGSKHEPRRCRAFGKKCYKCNQIGHFAEFCRKGDSKPIKNEKDSKDNVQEEVKKINQVAFSDSE